MGLIMTIQVIKYGDTRKECACHHCKSVLSYEPSDVIKQALYSMAEYEKTVYYIECPVCQYQISLKGK